MALEQRKTPFEEISPPDTAAAKRPAAPWHHRAAKLLAVHIYSAVGAFLLVFPWLSYWEQNYFSGLGAEWYSVWMNSYFRGAVSGLGAINICISFAELARLLRPSTGFPIK
jgi:hypothetical protein